MFEIFTGVEKIRWTQRTTGNEKPKVNPDPKFWDCFRGWEPRQPLTQLTVGLRLETGANKRLMSLVNGTVKNACDFNVLSWY